MANNAVPSIAPTNANVEGDRVASRRAIAASIAAIAPNVRRPNATPNSTNSDAPPKPMPPGGRMLAVTVSSPTSTPMPTSDPTNAPATDGLSAST